MEDGAQTYHGSSVVSCCDGAKPLLPGSVPENIRSASTINRLLCVTFFFKRKKNIYIN